MLACALFFSAGFAFVLCVNGRPCSKPEPGQARTDPSWLGRLCACDAALLVKPGQPSADPCWLGRVCVLGWDKEGQNPHPRGPKEAQNSLFNPLCHLRSRSLNDPISMCSNAAGLHPLLSARACFMPRCRFCLAALGMEHVLPSCLTPNVNAAQVFTVEIQAELLSLLRQIISTFLPQPTGGAAILATLQQVLGVRVCYRGLGSER
eukprot:1161186-Pelagomonas_calceolata.AAC.14